MVHPFKRFGATLFLLCTTLGVFSQNAVKDNASNNDIMFQTFGWDEADQVKIKSAGGFYNFYANQAQYLNDAGVDMMWFPPPSQSTGGTGYIPTRWFNFSITSWGSEDDMDACIAAYNDLDMYPIADVVVNHRGPDNGWTGFVEPVLGCDAICGNDDGGNTADNVTCTLGANDTGDDFSGVRDLDHTNSDVQQAVEDYLDTLKAKGFKGWRWDLAKGFSATYFGQYNTASSPYYAVGEYWDGNRDNLISWIDGTGGSSGAFDFANYYSMSNAIKNNSYGQLNSGGKMPGLSGVANYDDKAVTFVDNHDTFVHDDAFTGDDIMKAYAYILTHPGVPCVSAMHYYGGTYEKEDVTRTYSDHQEAINKLMGVRKQNGIYAWSQVHIDQAGSYYAAYVSPDYGADATVAVRIGNSTWEPGGSGWILNASGNDYAVWSKETITIPDPPAEATVDISLIGAGISDWDTDVMMTSTDNQNYTLTDYQFTGGGVKFRMNEAWTINWGGTDFPTGTGEEGSADNIPVTIGSYDVEFNRITGVYTFTLTSEPCVCTDDYEPVCADDVVYTNACLAECAGITDYDDGVCTISGPFEEIGIIGDATSDDPDVQWDEDVDMMTTDGFLYTLTYTFLTGDAKFRQDNAWTVNWGASSFPTGTGSQNGSDIPVTAGTYTVTFNRSTGEYTFTNLDNSISENAAIANLQVYPNPTQGAWNINADEAIESVELMDVAGRVVLTEQVGAKQLVLGGDDFPTGLYVAIVKSESGVSAIRLSKE